MPLEAWVEEEVAPQAVVRQLEHLAFPRQQGIEGLEAWLPGHCMRILSE